MLLAPGDNHYNCCERVITVQPLFFPLITREEGGNEANVSGAERISLEFSQHRGRNKTASPLEIALFPRLQPFSPRKEPSNRIMSKFPAKFPRTAEVAVLCGTAVLEDCACYRQSFTAVSLK